MDDYRLFNPSNGRWWVRQRRELDSLIAQALAEPKIADALRVLNIPAEEVARTLGDRDDVFARFSVARRWTVRLGLHHDVPDQRFPRMRPGYGLIAGVAVVTAYVSLLISAFPHMPVLGRVFSLVGLVAACALGGRLARKDIAIARRAVRAIRDPESASRIIQDVVLPELRQYIADHAAPPYGTDLSADQVDFDGDVFESATVVTTAGRQLRTIVQRYDADAIAIAGPRGVGKTTAIRAIADGMFSDVDEPPPLSVVASAPSRYDARDFVLHLHAVLCRRVIAVTSARLRLPPDDDTPRRTVWRRVQPWLIVGGCIVVLAALAMLFWGLSFLEPAGATDSQPRGETFAFLSGSDWTIGVARTLLEIALFVALCAAGVLVVNVFFAFVAGIARSGWRVAVRAWAGQLPELAGLREEAFAQLRRIRFLQTYTSGWSGKIGLPQSGDIGVSRSLQRAEQTLTHPEVVDNFRHFAQLCADQLLDTGMAGRLVIAIDELDKIADPAEAQEFVNDVKGVFGIRNCLFLVSVSEDAMAAFERRGIPVRDAFDSAFTQMVRLDAFTLSESRRWLSRRLLRVSEQFVYLLHCLAGGLPREMRRATIELVDVVREDDRGDLAYVAGALLDRELDRKAHAFAAAARRYDDSPELTTYLTDLLAMTDATVDHVELAKRLAPDGPVSDLHRIRWQSAGFVLFCATVREIFVNTLDQAGLAGVERLATARARLAVDPQLAWRLVESVRADRDPGPAPDAPTP